MALDLKLNISKENLLKSRVLLIGIAMGLIAAWYGYNNIYKNLMSSIQQVKTDINNENVNMDVAKRLGALQKEVNTYKGCFGKEADVLLLTDKVSKAANEAGLKIVSLTAQKPGLKKPFLYNSVGLAASGTFNQLGDFIARIESSKEFMRVEKLSFKKADKLLSAEIVITAYYWK